MKVGKPKSKRTPVRLRHKIQKASAAKQRKQRKDAKKDPQWRSRLKKDPGIPNLFPYKAKMLAELEDQKRRKIEEQQQRREIAKAQRQGAADQSGGEAAAEDEDDELLDEEDDEDVELDEEMDGQDDTNPMAALLASAQARAQDFSRDDEDESSAEEEDDEWDGIKEPESTRGPAKAAQGKELPRQALADPIKAVSSLLERMQQTPDGVQRLMDYYRVPPLILTGSDLSSRFLVEVARKTGRLGKGGVPNLHSAALTVLSDLNEERLQLPAVATSRPAAKQPSGIEKGAVQVVSQAAQPFRIEGLWGDNGDGEKMVVET